MKQVFVGMSGGVDSSLSAALLLEQGYAVTGVYMKNWTQDIAGWPCPWRQDYLDAQRVAVQLGIELKVFDFQKQYKRKVVDYMVAEYRAGRTPNPDIMCNQEIKFKLFLDTALEQGADLIATGHYARITPPQGPTLQPMSSTITNEPHTIPERTPTAGSDPAEVGDQKYELKIARDTEKDQTYFLYRITEEALRRTLFPIGEFASKDQVRTAAKKRNIPTADRPDSQGICFVGEVGIRDFLREFINVVPGPILDPSGKELGQHEGAILYTIGQRHGLTLGGGLPYYVTRVDTASNTVHVTSELSSDKLWSRIVFCQQAHWINRSPKKGKTYQARIRHRGELIESTIELINKNTFTADLTKDVRALTPGQSLVLYDDETVLGGGIIDATRK
jgi:tRNA-specific 2-thiouridylase